MKQFNEVKLKTEDIGSKIIPDIETSCGYVISLCYSFSVLNINTTTTPIWVSIDATHEITRLNDN